MIKFNSIPTDLQNFSIKSINLCSRTIVSEKQATSSANMKANTSSTLFVIKIPLSDSALRNAIKSLINKEKMKKCQNIQRALQVFYKKIKIKTKYKKINKKGARGGGGEWLEMFIGELLLHLLDIWNANTNC